MKYKRSANEGRDYLTNILEITILIAKHNAGKIKVNISNFILTNDKVCNEISYLLLPKLSFIKIDIYLFLCLFVFCFLKRHDEAHNTIHTNVNKSLKNESNCCLIKTILLKLLLELMTEKNETCSHSTAIQEMDSGIFRIYWDWCYNACTCTR